MSPVTVTGQMVIRAVWDLYDARGHGPTASEIADYLRVDVDPVLEQLRALKDERIFRDRRRGGERIWEPWKP